MKSTINKAKQILSMSIISLCSFLVCLVQFTQLFHLLYVQNCFAGKAKPGVEKQEVKTQKISAGGWWAQKKSTYIKCFIQCCSTWAFITALILLNWREKRFSSYSFSLICCFWQYFHDHSEGSHVLCGIICCVFSSLSLHFFSQLDFVSA